MGTSPPEVFEKKRKIDLDNLCVLAIDRDTMVMRGVTRVIARLKEKHPGILSCHQLFKLNGFGCYRGNIEVSIKYQETFSHIYKLSFEFFQGVATFTMVSFSKV